MPIVGRRTGEYTFLNSIKLGKIPTDDTATSTSGVAMPTLTNIDHDFRGVELKSLLVQSGTEKKVISTCYFLPSKPMWNEKIPNYLLNLIKNIEVYRKDRNRLPDGFLYRVYIDELLYETCREKETKRFWGSEFDYDIDEIVKGTEEYCDDMKENLKNYKSLFKLLRRYIKHILDNPTEYSFLELITFKCEGVMSPKVNGKDLPGHPKTFGSIIRYFAFWDPEVKIAFAVNSSCVLNLESKEVIEKFLKSTYIDYLMVYFQPNFEKVYKALSEKRDKFKDFLPEDEDSRLVSVLAALVGFKTTKSDGAPNPMVTEIKNLFENLLGKYKELAGDETKEDVWTYGIDEVLLFQAVRNILKDKKIRIPYNEGPIGCRENKELEFEMEGRNLAPYTNFNNLTDFTDAEGQNSYVIAILSRSYRNGMQLSQIYNMSQMEADALTQDQFMKNNLLQYILSSHSPNISFTDYKTKFPYVSKFGLGLMYNESIVSNMLTYYKDDIPDFLQVIQIFFCFDENKKLYLLAKDKLPKFHTRFFNLNSVTLKDILSYFENEILETTIVKSQVKIHQVSTKALKVEGKSHPLHELKVIKFKRDLAEEGNGKTVMIKDEYVLDLPFVWKPQEEAEDSYGDPITYMRVDSSTQHSGGGRIKSKRRNNKRGNNKRGNKRRLHKKYTKKRRHVKRR
jgi:hypothetical protein